MDPDFLLIQRMKMGDERAIDVFVRKYYPRILKYCRMHIADRGYAEDMTQETFERFFRAFHQYQHYGKAVNFLYVIAANCCKDHYRKKIELPLEELPERKGQDLEDAEEWMDVRNAVGRLPEEVRETAVLYFFQGLKQREIAKILGIGLPLVKYRIGRARELLAADLEREGKV